jgi:hypothetical protein
LGDKSIPVGYQPIILGLIYMQVNILLVAENSKSDPELHDGSEQKKIQYYRYAMPCQCAVRDASEDAVEIVLINSKTSD